MGARSRSLALVACLLLAGPAAAEMQEQLIFIDLPAELGLQPDGHVLQIADGVEGNKRRGSARFSLEVAGQSGVQDGKQRFTLRVERRQLDRFLKRLNAGRKDNETVDPLAYSLRTGLCRRGAAAGSYSLIWGAMLPDGTIVDNKVARTQVNAGTSLPVCKD